MMRGLMPGWGMGNQMDRVFEHMAEARWDDVLAVGDWAPSLDISETKDSLVAKVEVPGMEQKDIQISLQENLLTIKGEKRHERDDQEERYLRVERAYGLFLRSIRLPAAGGGGSQQGEGRVQERAADSDLAEDLSSQGHHDSDQGRVETMFYSIIVPTDFSACSQEAWSVAAMSRGELILTHVLAETPLYREGLSNTGTAGPGLRSAAEVGGDGARELGDQGPRRGTLGAGRASHGRGPREDRGTGHGRTRGSHRHRHPRARQLRAGAARHRSRSRGASGPVPVLTVREPA